MSEPPTAAAAKPSHLPRVSPHMTKAPPPIIDAHRSLSPTFLEALIRFTRDSAIALHFGRRVSSYRPHAARKGDAELLGTVSHSSWRGLGVCPVPYKHRRPIVFEKAVLF